MFNLSIFQFEETPILLSSLLLSLMIFQVLNFKSFQKFQNFKYLPIFSLTNLLSFPLLPYHLLNFDLWVQVLFLLFLFLIFPSFPFQFVLTITFLLFPCLPFLLKLILVFLLSLFFLFLHFSFFLILKLTKLLHLFSLSLQIAFKVFLLLIILMQEPFSLLFKFFILKENPIFIKNFVNSIHLQQSYSYVPLSSLNLNCLSFQMQTPQALGILNLFILLSLYLKFASSLPLHLQKNKILN